MYDSYLESVFGKRYILKRHFEIDINHSFHALEFSDENQIYSFLCHLHAPLDYWHKVSTHVDDVTEHNINLTEIEAKLAVSKLIHTKHLLLFELPNVSLVKTTTISSSKTSTSSRSRKGTNKQKDGDYSFRPASTLLVSNKQEVVPVKTKPEIEALIEDLDPDENQLKQIASELNLSASETVGGEALTASLVEEIHAGNVVVAFQPKVNAPPVAEVVDETIAVEKNAGLGPESTEQADDKIKVTAKIDAEYKVTLLERKLSDHQEAAEDKIVADATAIELWLEQDKPSPVFDEGAKISIAGAGAIELFKDEAKTQALDTNEVIAKEDITGGSKLRVWAVGTTAGKCTIELTPEVSSNGDFVNQPPASYEFGVVELKIDIHQQDVGAIAGLQVDPDTDPVSDYYTDLENKNLPEQIVLSDEDKVKRGRLLHVQKDASFGRAKLILIKPQDDQFPDGCDDYEIIINSHNKSGSLKLFDAEFDGTEIALPLKIKKKDLDDDKTYWVEGTAETDKLLDAQLYAGVDRASGGMAKSVKKNGDWLRFSVVKIDEIKLDYTAPAAKANAWDSAKKRFFINLKTGNDGRKITIKAKLGKALKDIVVHFMLVEDQNNRKAANWGVDLPNDPAVHEWKWKDIDAAVKQLDKTDRKNLLHVSDKTDVNGEVSKEVMLSQFGGDKFYLAAYIEQDPHLCKYIHEHASLGKRKPVMADNEINVWRKFWYQEVKVAGVNVAGFGNAADCYEDVKVVMEAAPAAVEMTRVAADALNPKAIYPKHMLSYYVDPATNTYKNNFANDASDGLMVGDDNEADFWALVVESDERPVMVPMMNVNGLWIEDGDSGAANTPWDEGGFPYTVETDKQLLDPPIQGGTLYKGGRIVAEDWDAAAGSWVNNRTVNLSSADLELDPGRSDPFEVNIKKPAALVLAARTRFKVENLVVRGGTNFLGTSYDDGIVNSYTPNDVQDFINTINHELGHSFKQVAKVHPAGIPDHPHQYDDQGSHCDYRNKSCLMYESGPQPAALNRFCPVCHPHVLVQDMTEV